ncbi:MAG: LysM peptidoglycan-binding domain-containing protein [Dokdonella sp.]
MGNEPNKPNFSNVQGSAASSAPNPAPKADFSNVNSSVQSSAPVVDAPAARTYTVVAGDSLSKIAKHVYGDANRWHDIFNANRDLLDNPDRIQPGQILKLPANPASNA